MPHGPRFEQLCSEAKSRIREISCQDAVHAQAERAVLLDVREAADFEKEHAAGAMHLSKGVVEMKIEEKVPDLSTPIVCYRGGGNRSALVADSLQKMGYENVHSMVGGFRAWKEAGFATES